MEYTVIYFSYVSLTSVFKTSVTDLVTEYLKFSNGCMKRQEKAG